MLAIQVMLLCCYEEEERGANLEEGIKSFYLFSIKGLGPILLQPVSAIAPEN